MEEVKGLEQVRKQKNDGVSPTGTGTGNERAVKDRMYYHCREFQQMRRKETSKRRIYSDNIL